MIQQNRNINVMQVKWSHPMGLKELSQIFEVHRNTMSKWLKNQNVCNRKLSPRKWEVAIFELPYDLTSDNPEKTDEYIGERYF